MDTDSREQSVGVENRLASFDCEVVAVELVDSPKICPIVSEKFIRANVDLVICYVTTYGTSSQILPIAQQVKRPVLILNLQPTPAVDYARTDTQGMLEDCNVCVIPELACVFNRWCSHGPAHHWALGVGHVRSDLERIANLMKLEIVYVC